MLDNFMKWRDDQQVTTILHRYNDFAIARECSKKYNESTLFSIDKQGQPVNIERKKNSNDEAYFNEVPVDINIGQSSIDTEMLVNVIFPYCSKLANKRIEQIVCITDADDMNLGPYFKGEVRDYMKKVMEVAQDNYPELMQKFIVVNTPFMMYAVWAVFKVFLNKDSRKKFEFQRGKAFKHLNKYIDADQLPDFLGGTVKDVFPESIGPWQPYEDVCIKRQSFWPEELLCNGLAYDGIVGDPLERAKHMKIDNLEIFEVGYVDPDVLMKKNNVELQ